MIGGYKMTLEDLKLFTLFYIKESKNISNKEKISLMEYVEKAEESDILFLLATGYTPGRYIPIEELGGVAYRFYESEEELEKPWGYTTTSLMSTAIFYPLAYTISHKIKKKYMDKNMKKCEKESGSAKKACYNKIRKDAIRAQIVALSSMKVKCRSVKNTEKCIKDIDAQIKNLQIKMNAIKVF